MAEKQNKLHEKIKSQDNEIKELKHQIRIMHQMLRALIKSTDEIEFTLEKLSKGDGFRKDS